LPHVPPVAWSWMRPIATTCSVVRCMLLLHTSHVHTHTPPRRGIIDPPQLSERSSHHIIYKFEYIIFSHSSETAQSPDTYPPPHSRRTGSTSTTSFRHFAGTTTFKSLMINVQLTIFTRSPLAYRLLLVGLPQLV